MKARVVECLANFSGTISEVIVKDSTISLSVYADEGLGRANQIKHEIDHILASNFPQTKILISITNRSTSSKRFKIIVVSSGKGGVGKSTISAAIASYLQSSGKKVGLLDADIYGPSIPEIMGLVGFKADVHDGMIVPAEVCSVKVMSMGFMVAGDGAFAWRGPMLGKAINQLFNNVNWGALDYLIVDTPPGTGDVHLSIFGNYRVDNALIVTIPSEVAANDVARCIDLHQKFGINIHGIIENMSYYQLADEQIPIFGKGAGEKLAERFNLPLLVKVPLISGLTNLPFAELHKYIQIDLGKL